MSIDENRRKWHQALTVMVADYRGKHPEDSRSDIQLVESMLEDFYKSGLVKKGKNGKWILPELVGPLPLIN